MAKFLTLLDQVLLDEDGGDGRAIWRLDKPLIYQSDMMGEITVPGGFQHDSASVPRLPVAWWLTGDTAHSAAVIHDYLYSCRGNLPDGRVTASGTSGTTVTMLCLWAPPSITSS